MGRALIPEPTLQTGRKGGPRALARSRATNERVAATSGFAAPDLIRSRPGSMPERSTRPRLNHRFTYAPLLACDKRWEKPWEADDDNAEAHVHSDHSVPSHRNADPGWIVQLHLRSPAVG